MIFLSQIEVDVDGFGRKDMHWKRNSKENPNMNFVGIYGQWMVRKIDFRVTAGKAKQRLGKTASAGLTVKQFLRVFSGGLMVV